MHYTGRALLLVLGVAAPLIASAFVPSVTFSRAISTSVVLEIENQNASCNKRHNRQVGCKCPACAMGIGGYNLLALSMSDVAEAEAEEVVPNEVVAMDGVESEEEAHNVERPARASGTAKHSSRKDSGTPLAELEVGSSFEATVKAVASYGAFMDIGASTDALCHVSRLSDDFVSDVNDIVSVGDKVQVRIINIDTEKGQVAVTMRSEEAESNAASRGRGGGGGRNKDRPRRSNGDREAQRVAMSSLVDAGFDSDKFIEGEVQSTLDFGAFVRFSIGDYGETLEGELDGLVHISALAEGRVSKVTDICKPGDKVQIRIKGVDVEGGKVSLSMITKEQEPQQRKGGGNRRAKQQFTDEEMGAKDWKEQLETLKADMPTFNNAAVVVDKRK